MDTLPENMQERLSNTLCGHGTFQILGTSFCLN